MPTQIRSRPAPKEAPETTARDRIAARLSRFGGAPEALRFAPSPFMTGDAGEAARLARGSIRLSGALVEVVETPDAGQDIKHPWDLRPPSPEWEAALHGFDWLDHYAAAASGPRRILSGWAREWIARYGGGAGPGWRADVVGRRLAAWARHATGLTADAPAAEARAVLRAIARDARFQRRRWRSAPQGLPACHAASGLIYAALALDGVSGAPLEEAAAAIAETARATVAADGAVPSRAPEDLAAILGVLVAARRAMGEAGRLPDPDHETAIFRLAAALRALRHPSGALVRAYGGGAGSAEALDRTLALMEARALERPDRAMGFERLSSGRTVVFFDAGAAPEAPAAGEQSLSVFAIEASFGRDPVIVSCGPGARFGRDWRASTRAPEAFSTLSIDDAPASVAAAALTLGPGHVALEREADPDAVRLGGAHDGWLKHRGLTHRRSLALTADGLDFRGEDRLEALGPGPQAAFDQAAGLGDRMKIGFTIRFHLHPDVEATLFLAGGAVKLVTPSGHDWVMRQLGGALSLEDSVYLDEAAGRPRATKQIVVRADAKDYRGVVKWAFRRSDTHLRAAARGTAAGDGSPDDPS